MSRTESKSGADPQQSKELRKQLDLFVSSRLKSPDYQLDESEKKFFDACQFQRSFANGFLPGVIGCVAIGWNLMKKPQLAAAAIGLGGPIGVALEYRKDHRMECMRDFLGSRTYPLAVRARSAMRPAFGSHPFLKQMEDNDRQVMMTLPVVDLSIPRDSVAPVTTAAPASSTPAPAPAPGPAAERKQTPWQQQPQSQQQQPQWRSRDEIAAEAAERGGFAPDVDQQSSVDDHSSRADDTNTSSVSSASSSAGWGQAPTSDFSSSGGGSDDRDRGAADSSWTEQRESGFYNAGAGAATMAGVRRTDGTIKGRWKKNEFGDDVFVPDS